MHGQTQAVDVKMTDILMGTQTTDRQIGTLSRAGKGSMGYRVMDGNGRQVSTKHKPTKARRCGQSGIAFLVKCRNYGRVVDVLGSGRMASGQDAAGSPKISKHVVPSLSPPSAVR
jgi:hypothetical protein